MLLISCNVEIGLVLFQSSFRFLSGLFLFPFCFLLVSLQANQMVVKFPHRASADAYHPESSNILATSESQSPWLMQRQQQQQPDHPSARGGKNGLAVVTPVKVTPPAHPHVP